MKKEIALLTAIAISAHALCQGGLLTKMESNNGKVKYGVKAGLAIAKSKVEYNPSITPYNKIVFKAGAMAGGYAQIKAGKNACFQPELLIVGKGMKEKYEAYSYRNDVTYIELPLNILYKPVTSKGSFFIGGGPSPAYYIGENFFYSGQYFIKKFDLGINLLAGYEMPIGFSINLHYTHGLTNISRSAEVLLTKNRCFGLSVGYIF